MAVTHILRHCESHTTARYFEKAARADAAADIRVWTEAPRLEEIRPEDCFVFIDPAPDWPLGLEALPCPTLAYFIDVHLGLPIRLTMSRLFDAVFIAQKDYVPAFVAIGHRHAHWLPLACDPDEHAAASPVRDIEVGFVGKLGAAGTDRHTVLTTVLPRYATNDYGRFYPPEEMARIYGRSKIVLNASINGDVNMRAFEAWASGALLVTDRISNGFDEIFKEGVNCVCYSSPEEAVEVIDHYLANDVEREAIAAAGRRDAFARHTYRTRWAAMMELSQGAFDCAPARGYTPKQLGELYSGIFVSLRMPWRIPPVIARYGLGNGPALGLATSLARWVNASVPLTPNALRTRFRAK